MIVGVPRTSFRREYSHPLVWLFHRRTARLSV